MLKKLNGSMKTYKTFRTNTQKDVLFIIEDWNAKVGNQETTGVQGAHIQNLGKHLFSAHGGHQMANTEIRLIIFFAAKNGEALYRQ